MSHAGHAHDHAPPHDHAEVSEKRLLFTVGLNLVITAAEVVGGLLSGSLSLVSDALHNLSDAVSVVISLFAIRLGRRENNLRQTFGYRRAEIMAALFNAAVMIGIAVFLFREAIERWRHPVPVRGGLMIGVALVGLAANGLCVWLLHRESLKSLNVRSAYLHLLVDTFSSVGVVAGGIFISAGGAVWIDPLLSVLIAAYVLKESYSILRQSVHILMQAAPPHIDLLALQREVAALPGIHTLHHVHLWQMDDRTIHLEAHVGVDGAITIHEADGLRRRVEKVLAERFGIQHITLQMEPHGCCDDDLIHRSGHV